MRMSRRYSAHLLVGAVLVAAPATRADDFATKVICYEPADGQFVGDPAYSDPADALGPPEGQGLTAGNNTTVVTLGGFLGSITLGFDRTVINHPGNPMGLDAIVFGNAFHQQGDPQRRWAEAALIEIALDINQNGLADDPWYIIPGSSLTLPFDLPLPSDFDGPILTNSNPTTEDYFGYADLSPTLFLGDTNADNTTDDPQAKPEEFYTNPDDPLTVGVSPGSGGGDAFDISWAIDPESGEPAGLIGFDFIRLTTAVDSTNGAFGEVSTEIDAVADVRAMGLECIADVNGDGQLTPADFTAWIAAYQSGDAFADQNLDGLITPADFTAWIANYSSNCAES